MKDIHLRKDKTCLNCGVTVEERYCSHCGQENIEPKESFTHLIGHFFADFTHYDAKVFTTIKDLAFKPGFLTNAYNSGKRTSYLNPIRMYIFISALFFIIAFSQHQNSKNSSSVENKNQLINPYRQHLADSLRTISKQSGVHDFYVLRNQTYQQLAHQLDTVKTIDSSESASAMINNAGILKFHFVENKYKDIRQFDSVQRNLTSRAKIGLLNTYISHKIIRLTQEQGRRSIDVEEDIKHDLPKLMFILLPFFALSISVFYDNKKYIYSQHVIFSLHFNCFMFLCFFVVNIITMIFKTSVVFDVIWVISLVTIFVYLALALFYVYKESLWLCFVKSIAILVTYALTLILCLCIFISVNFLLI